MVTYVGPIRQMSLSRCRLQQKHMLHQDAIMLLTKKVMGWVGVSSQVGVGRALATGHGWLQNGWYIVIIKT